MSQGLESPEAAMTAEGPEPDAPPSVASPEPDVAVAPSRRGGGAWLWVRVALVVVLLGASALARAWQARRVDQILRDGRVSPCRLADLPETLGPWVGQSEAMDSAIARATGSTDSIFRSYQHKVTGQKLSLIVLFGPSTEMFVHSPDNCYPAAGYHKTRGPTGRTIKSGPASWPFFETVYAKGEGGKAEQQEVYCTWRYSEVWTPGLTTQKGFERIPGMFKVQVGRQVQDKEIELLEDGNPCEAFLSQLMPEIDRRIAEGRAKSRAAIAAK
jgi:hypothetical protein